MNRRSIRWQLPLSYAAIALLAALALGAVLLLTLRSYYLRVEREYLQSNAQAIGVSLAQLLEGDPAYEALPAQLDTFSLLSQTRVQYFDAAGQLVASSGSPGRYHVAFADVLARAPLPGDGRSVVVLRPGDLQSMTITTTGRVFFPLVPGPDGRLPLPEGAFLRTLPISGEAIPAETGGEAEGVYSSQVVRVPVHKAGEKLLGYVELSQGPAYAREIVGDVAVGWGIASAVAVALAAAVGWLVSRRISTPLLALTETTTSMADGDLSARADARPRDEFGTLACSFNRMADRIEQTVVSLRRFVSDAAHEIHTPLTALRTNLELATQDGYVQEAQVQLERLEALTEGLLDLSRMEAAVDLPALAEVPMDSLVREVSERYASRAEQAGLAFALSLPEAPVRVRGEEAQLRRALNNLLDNAVKFTPDGGSVRLALSREEGWAVACVEDTGIGIPEGDLPHVFQRFHRGRNTAGYPGSGLGLAIVKAIAERHGGDVGVEMTVQGTRFTFRVPLQGAGGLGARGL
jgi:signal transduction histidine kinase